VAFDVTPLQNAHRFRGIGTYVRGLAQRLSAQTEVPIEFWGWEGEHAFTPPPPHSVLWLPRFPMPQYRGAWLFARLAMRRRAAKSSVTAVHITDPDALTPLPGRRLLSTVYDLTPLKQGLARNRLVARAGYSTYLKALARVDTMFAISNETAQDLVDMLALDPHKILIARPGVDIKPKDAGDSGLPRSRGRWRGAPDGDGEGELGLPRSRGRWRGAPDGDVNLETQPYFLFLGGPDPNKNLSVLLRAMTICTELLEVLYIAGHWLPKQVAGLNAVLASRGLSERVQHIGFIPDGELAGLMRDATALVVPSRFEGFGLPVGEGLAAGAAVIHSNIPVLKETSSGAAVTFSPESEEELAACLRRLATDAALSKELRALGVQRAQSLTWDAAVQTTLTAYSAILPPSSGREGRGEGRK
jgi:glycosyltransferase involved in cell wall biosynthesis